eukprot:m.34113 g.34113  ORF g.34113 m.34113 type:complete len:344 (-) comp16933_c1_seq1:216-1247(-)
MNEYGDDARGNYDNVACVSGTVFLVEDTKRLHSTPPLHENPKRPLVNTKHTARVISNGYHNVLLATKKITLDGETVVDQTKNHQEETVAVRSYSPRALRKNLQCSQPPLPSKPTSQLHVLKPPLGMHAQTLPLEVITVHAGPSQLFTTSTPSTATATTPQQLLQQQHRHRQLLQQDHHRHDNQAHDPNGFQANTNRDWVNTPRAAVTSRTSLPAQELPHPTQLTKRVQRPLQTAHSLPIDLSLEPLYSPPVLFTADVTPSRAMSDDLHKIKSHTNVTASSAVPAHLIHSPTMRRPPKPAPRLTQWLPDVLPFGEDSDGDDIDELVRLSTQLPGPPPIPPKTLL